MKNILKGMSSAEKLNAIAQMAQQMCEEHNEQEEPGEQEETDELLPQDEVAAKPAGGKPALSPSGNLEHNFHAKVKNKNKGKN